MKQRIVACLSAILMIGVLDQAGADIIGDLAQVFRTADAVKVEALLDQGADPNSAAYWSEEVLWKHGTCSADGSQCQRSNRDGSTAH